MYPPFLAFRNTGFLVLIFLSCLSGTVAQNSHQITEAEELLSRSKAIYMDSVYRSQYYANQAIQLLQGGENQALLSEAYLCLGVGYSIRTEYDSASITFLRAIEASEEFPDGTLLAKILLNQGIVAYRTGKFQEALGYYDQSLQKYRDMADTAGIARTHTNLGNVFFTMGDLSNAKEAYRKSLELKTSLGDSVSIVSPLINIGLIYKQENELVQAFRYFTQAEDILHAADKGNHQLQMVTIYSNLGALFLQAKLYESAKQYFWQAREIQREMRLDKAFAGTLLNLAEISAAQDSMELAQSYFRSCETLRKEHDGVPYLQNSYAHWARILEAHGYHDFAKQYAEESMFLAETDEYWQGKAAACHVLAKWAQRNGDTNALVHYSKALVEMITRLPIDSSVVFGLGILSDLAHARGDNEEALAYLLQYKKLQDSVMTRQKRAEVNTLELLRMQQERLREDQEQAQENMQALSHAQLRIKGSTIALIALLLIAIHLFFMYLRNRKNNRILNQKNDALQETKSEQTRLIGIMTHDLRTPVTQLQALRAQLEEELEQEISPQANQLLTTMEKPIYRLFHTIDRILALNQLDKSQQTPAPSSIFSLRNQVLSACDQFEPTATLKGIGIVFHQMDEGRILQSMEMVGEVLENLISNAIKFSIPGRKVHLSIIEGANLVEFRIRDEGPGISAEELPKLFGRFQKLRARPTGGEPSTGLGLAIVKEYMDRMGAEIRCESEVGVGTTFILRFPLGR